MSLIDFHSNDHDMTEELRAKWPKFIANRWGNSFSDCLYIRCDGPMHSAGIAADGSVVWENHSDGFDAQMALAYGRHQVSPAWIAALLHAINNKD